jgi:hypothetical protein
LPIVNVFRCLRDTPFDKYNKRTKELAAIEKESEGEESETLKTLLLPELVFLHL